MQQDHFFTLAVGAGFLLIGLVVYSYLRPKPEHRPSVTALLGLLGFALVASPNWTRISIRSDGLELSLLREIEGRQLRALTALHERLDEDATPGASARPDASATPVAPAGPAAPGPRAADGVPGAPGPASQPAVAPPTPTHDRADRPALVQRDAALEPLIDAYRRGELDLSALSDEELLALNDRVSAAQPRGGAGRLR